jgi:hypothetical protein
MVHIKFTAMALESVADVSMEHRESSTKKMDIGVTDEQAIVSTEATSERDVGSEDDNASNDTGDNGNASDNGGHVKIGAEAALVGISYDFGRSKVMRCRISDLENSFRFFSKGFARPLGVESIPVPKENEGVVFEDFFHCWPSHTSAPYAFRYTLQILCATALTHTQCYCANQQAYLGCYFLWRSS